LSFWWAIQRQRRLRTTDNIRSFQLKQRFPMIKTMVIATVICQDRLGTNLRKGGISQKPLRFPHREASNQMYMSSNAQLALGHFAWAAAFLGSYENKSRRLFQASTLNFLCVCSEPVLAN
jgi:hypothetical protein